MENATKALLIAAAVLIAILLIAFGMRIFSSTSDVSSQASSTGTQISEEAKKAETAANSALDGIGDWGKGLTEDPNNPNPDDE